MSNDLFFERTYTALPGLQAKRAVRYALACGCTGEGRFGLRITEEGPSGISQQEIVLAAHKQADAQSLLTYLYENAVPLNQCASVVSDACAALQQEDQNGT